MAAIPPPLPHFGSDVPGWGWDEKREFQLSSTYAFLMKAVDRNRSPKCSFARIALVAAIHGMRQQDWQICINHICRDRNGVADKLASLGLHQTMEGGFLLCRPVLWKCLWLTRSNDARNDCLELNRRLQSVSRLILVGDG
ncbi:hypothetical protein V6N12_054399 [Hibiscus sabdariffa]|uniref:RNase H type-1 domain-containing protein n=1 Tax=Hibiscus sabdariffa TaxID=183260 RepID=A0ABR2D0C1_9ROSI